MRIRKRLAQLGLIMVALPLVGWGLDQLAKRAEERRPGSGKWLRQGSDFAHRLRARPPVEQAPRSPALTRAPGRLGGA